MKFKVGDKVIDEVFGEGKVVETNNKEILVQFKKANDILHNGSSGINGPYEENTCYWFLKNTTNLKKIKDYTYEELKKSPIGSKITFENGAVLVKDEKNCFENVSRYRDIADLCNLKDNYSDLGKIIKIEEPVYSTVYEAKKEILDDAEKRYLRGFVRPFRDRVKYIKKFVFPTYNSMIEIGIERDNSTWHISLPPFATNDMYKGMKDDKEYTLEDLGL